MTTKLPILARPSKLGSKGFQYPDIEGKSVLIPKEASLVELPWVGGGGWSAWSWADADGTRVVWLKASKVCE